MMYNITGGFTILVQVLIIHRWEVRHHNHHSTKFIPSIALFLCLDSEWRLKFSNTASATEV